MKVYLLISQICYEPTDIYGVFSSKQKAIEFMEQNDIEPCCSHEIISIIEADLDKEIIIKKEDNIQYTDFTDTDWYLDQADKCRG